MNTWKRRWTMVAEVPALVVLLMAGCTFDPSGVPVDDTETGGDPGPDAPGGPDARPTCVPGCEGDDLRSCEPEPVLIACPLGCAAEAGACRALVPSNGAMAVHLQDATARLVIPGHQSSLIDTDTGLVEIGGAPARPATEEDGVMNGIGVYRLDTGVTVISLTALHVERGAILRIWGSRPLVILSEGDVVLEGIIDISAGCTEGHATTCGGPGGGDGATDTRLAAEGCAPGGNGTGADGGRMDETGGGGGGLGTDGAPGGDGGNLEPGGSGGARAEGPCPGPALVPLRGGAGGGAGGIDDAGGAGGGGGGGVQITSLTRIAITGQSEDPQAGALPAGIVAAGGGGGGGRRNGGGGGGGAGGAILLEAPSVELTKAVLTANGGGGGGGSIDDSPGTRGRNGSIDAHRARGGGVGNVQGGLGASRLGAATSGAGGGDNTGGGGGGAGIIRLDVPAAGLTIMDSIISPAHTRGVPAAE